MGPKGTTSARVTLTATPLTAEAFSPYGEVIQSTGTPIAINQGMGQRYADLARIDVTQAGGRAAISRVACIPEKLPVRLRLMERHPLSSQAFVPLDAQRYLVVVARAGAAPAKIQAFVATGHQGINYAPGTWHHPLIALDRKCEFVEIHRVGPGGNYDEARLEAETEVVLPGPAGR